MKAIVIKKVDGQDRDSKDSQQVENKNKLNAYKYCGVLKIEQSPLEIKNLCEMNGSNLMIDTNIALYLLKGDVSFIHHFST